MREVMGVCVPDGATGWLDSALRNANYERHMLRLVRRYIAGHRVLEGGSGIGYITRALTERAEEVVSCEVNYELWQCARKNAPGARVMLRVLRSKGWPPPNEKPPETGDGFGVETKDQPDAVDPNDLINAFRLNAVVLDVEGEESDILLNLNLEPLQVILVEMHPELSEKGKLGEAHIRLLEHGFEAVEEIADGPLWHLAYVRKGAA